MTRHPDGACTLQVSAYHPQLWRHWIEPRIDLSYQQWTRNFPKRSLCVSRALQRALTMPKVVTLDS
jgi:hypothetical protein